MIKGENMSHYTIGQEQDVKRALQLLAELVKNTDRIATALEVLAEDSGPIDDEYRPPQPVVDVELPEEDTESPEYTEAVLKAATTFEQAAEMFDSADRSARGDGGWSTKVTYGRPEPVTRRVKDDPQA
jgi:hypothetical protein